MNVIPPTDTGLAHHHGGSAPALGCPSVTGAFSPQRQRESRLQTIIESRVTGTELKKHVGAIHVKAHLSLLQRKLSNVLLLNAYEELPDPSVKEHEIPVRVLAEYDSKDFAYLRDALRALVDCRVEWNVLDENGDEEWAAASLLAQAKTKGGTCRYVYAPDLREKLYRPEVYARINLAIQARFGSGYALALYENCARFRKVGTTGWIDLATWRDLLGVGEEQYTAFKALRQKVLAPAIKEVNEFSDVRVAMETQRAKRRIVALKFVVSEAPAHEPGMAAKGLGLREALGAEGAPDARSAAPEPAEVIEDHPLVDLQRRLLGFGLTAAQALDLSTEFDADRVERNLGYVEVKLAAGDDVKNLAAYTVAAVRGDYERGDRAARRKRGEAKAKGPKAADQPGLFPTAEVVAVRSLGEEDAAEGRQLDAAIAALSDADRAALDTEAVALLREQGSGWWREVEGAVESGETDGLGIAVRSVLRVARRDAMRARGAAV